MQKLYGEKTAEQLVGRLEALGSQFSEAVQNIAYDYFWELPGLSLRDKSFITLAALIAQNKEEQTRIHYYGFLNAGGGAETLVALLQYLKLRTNVTKAFAALKEVLSEEGRDFPLQETSLEQRDQDLANLSVEIALGDLAKLKSTMMTYLKAYPDGQEEIQQVLMHQIVYCGFPASMNGFAILKNLREGVL